MRHSLHWFVATPVLAFLLAVAGLQRGHAQTPICGTINSATWTPAGNPYIIGCDSTVPSGQTLTIQPGVIVWLGSNVTLTVNGSIQAAGTTAQRISFQSAVPSQYWNTIQLNYSGATNRFKFCDLQGASTALSLNILGGNTTMYAEVFNCSFSNCIARALYGVSEGFAGGNCPLSTYSDARLKFLIKNCLFAGTSNACVISISGRREGCFGNIGYGYSDSLILCNVFQNLTGTALSMNAGSYAGGGHPLFINNTIVNCRVGVSSQDPYDARIQDNIFVGCTNAVKRTGSLSLTASYNDFYGNATNFTGYPANYGQWLIPNRNGTLADLFFNIGENPLFVATDDYHLATNSACIDAGAPDYAFTDMCFPPGQGNDFPDLGAYGGPDACNWLDTVPLLSTTQSISKSNNVFSLSWGAIPRSSYEVQYVTNLAIDHTWKTLMNVTAAEKPVFRAIVTTNRERYFRIQSLGRAQGN